MSTLKRDHLNGKFHFPSINLARNTGNHTATILRIPRIYSADIRKISLEINGWTMRISFGNGCFFGTSVVGLGMEKAEPTKTRSWTERGHKHVNRLATPLKTDMVE